MPDREKVIKNLEWFRDRNSWNEGIMIYDDNAEIRKRICDDALALLEEHEAVEPLAQDDGTFKCSCGTAVGWDVLYASGIVRTRFKYCPFCGRGVKWDA